MNTRRSTAENFQVVRSALLLWTDANRIGVLGLSSVWRDCVTVRAEAAKLRRPRRVPLWWDAGTFEDLTVRK